MSARDVDPTDGTPDDDLRAERATTTGVPSGTTAEPRSAVEPDAPSGAGPEPLFEPADAERYRQRWHTVQASFVDEPRAAVEQADQLVGQVIQQLTKVFADERASLDAQLGRSGDVSTEDLREALRRYRSFFERLLSM